jgi:hypothetical protein
LVEKLPESKLEFTGRYLPAKLELPEVPVQYVMTANEQMLMCGKSTGFATCDLDGSLIDLGAVHAQELDPFIIAGKDVELLQDILGGQEEDFEDEADPFEGGDNFQAELARGRWQELCNASLVGRVTYLRPTFVPILLGNFIFLCKHHFC